MAKRAAPPTSPTSPTDPTPPTSQEEEPSEMMGLPVEWVDLATLRSHPRNYQSHPDDELAHIIESLREHGWYRPVIVARGDVILAGHGVKEAALKAGLTRGPVIRKDYDPDEPRALKLLVADNEIRHLAEKDDRALTEMLRELAEADKLLGTGFDEMMLASLVLVTRPASEIEDLDAAGQWVGMPEYDEEGPQKRLQIIFNFEREEDRVDLCARLGLDAKSIPTEGARKSVWWPPRKFDDNTSIRFTEASSSDEEEREDEEPEPSVSEDEGYDDEDA